MKVKIPESLKLEHEELHSQLAEATKVGGKIADAAKHVAQTLHPYFVAEEEFAIPPLGILPWTSPSPASSNWSTMLSAEWRARG